LPVVHKWWQRIRQEGIHQHPQTGTGPSRHFVSV
jgi:hypothetical protein